MQTQTPITPAAAKSLAVRYAAFLRAVGEQETVGSRAAALLEAQEETGVEMFDPRMLRQMSRQPEARAA